MQMAELVQAGGLDLTIAGGFLANFWPKFGIIDLPYIFNSKKDFNKVLWGPIGDELVDGLLKNANMRLLVWWPSGFRNVLTRNTPVNKLEDLRGLKLRVHENPLVVRTFKLLGANAVPMAYGEVYTSLKSGVIDAMENPLTSIANMRFGEVAKHLAYTSHFFLVEPLVMSEVLYKKLPKDIQDALVESAEATKATAWPILDEAAEKALVEIRKLGVKETHPDLAPFREAVKPIYTEYGKKLKAEDMVQKILEISK
jgi:tripartite ATP-independent transporter DctP family solute receptor